MGAPSPHAARDLARRQHNNITRGQLLGLGYTPKAIKSWADKAHEWEKGAGKKKRDVFVYMISGAKERAPAAAKALIERLRSSAKN